MATITVTTPTFLDGGTARVAGDVYNISSTFTIRTDTRVHANAPASMTGSLNNVIVQTATGGTIVVDATAVRWMPFGGGSGTVPAIGTTVSQGGVSGYLLGVWADYVSAPVAAGGTMPASGYMKFRSVTGGAFAAGTLTGISATATSPDVTGWIELAMDTGTSLQAQELGGGVVVSGGWFYLDSTTGVRGQQIGTPTNGGGTGTHVFGVQIETAPGSNVYEWFPTASSTLGGSIWATANLTTDRRAKLVESMGNGVIRIGSNGSVDIGYLPPAGCKIRIPNIFGRTVTVAARATNQVPGATSRAGFTGANYTIDGMHCDFTIAGTNAPHFSLKNFCSETIMSVSNNRDSIVIDNICLGGFTSAASTTFTIDTVTGGTVNAVKVVNGTSILGAMRTTLTNNVTFTNIEAMNIKSRTALAFALVTNATNNCTWTNVKLRGAGWNVTTCNYMGMYNVDLIDRLEGPTTAVIPTQMFNLAQSSYLTIDGVTFGDGGLLDNTQCYNSIINSGTNPNSNCKFRNFGTRTNPLSSGTSATFYPTNIFAYQAGDTYMKYQRMYVTGTRTAPFAAPSSSAVGVVIEDVYGTYSQAVQETGRNAVYRKIGSALPGTSPTSNAGTHWTDHFTSDTAGALRWYGSAPTPESSDKNYLVVTPNLGTGYIGTSAAISLDTIGDVAYSESPWTFLGHTSFQNAAPVIGGTSAGMTIYYQLDTGGGYSGTWALATGANLAAETISPTGFRMKIRILQTTAVSTNALTSISFLTNSTVAAQAANMYPLDTVSLSFTGLQIGSEVRAYVGTDPATAVEIGGTESTGSNTFTFSHSNAGQVGVIAIFALGYQPIYLPYTYQSTDTSLLIQQVIDRNYYNPA